MDRSLYFIGFTMLIGTSTCQLREFAKCQDDFSLKPSDGILENINAFTWLGHIQYTHDTVRAPHPTKAPRVILIHKQFVLGTVKAMKYPPKNYVLDSVIFARYERDGDSCGFQMSDFRSGKTCPPASLEIPPANIITHPEYLRFGVGNSVAIMKLIRPLLSDYMVPVCLPTIQQRSKLRKTRSVFLIDYNSIVPSSSDLEIMAKITYDLHTDEECRMKIEAIQSNVTENISNMLCTTGCGVRPGAPILSHESSGPFQLIGIATYSGPCTTSDMRQQFNADPPRYIDVYPYVTWIINVVTAHVIPKPFPHRLMERDDEYFTEYSLDDMIVLRQEKAPTSRWVKNVFVQGDCCDDKTNVHNDARGGSNTSAHFFYAESFFVNTTVSSKLKIYLRISGGVESNICCLKMKLPNNKIRPNIKQMGPSLVDLELGTDWFPEVFAFTMAMMAKPEASPAARSSSNYWLP